MCSHLGCIQLTCEPEIQCIHSSKVQRVQRTIRTESGGISFQFLLHTNSHTHATVRNSMDEPTTSGAVNTQSKRKNQRRSINGRTQHNHQTHSFNKKAVSKPNQRKCDIYVSNKSNSQVGPSHLVSVILCLCKRQA